MVNDCDAVLIGICRCHGVVGEMASVKRRKLWKMGEDGLCCSSSATQTRLGPSSLLEERNGVPIVFVALLCCQLPPKLGEMAKVYRYRYLVYRELYHLVLYTCPIILPLIAGL